MIIRQRWLSIRTCSHGFGPSTTSRSWYGVTSPHPRPTMNSSTTLKSRANDEWKTIVSRSHQFIFYVWLTLTWRLTQIHLQWTKSNWDPRHRLRDKHTTFRGKWTFADNSFGVVGRKKPLFLENYFYLSRLATFTRTWLLTDIEQYILSILVLSKMICCNNYSQD